MENCDFLLRCQLEIYWRHDDDDILFTEYISNKNNAIVNKNALLDIDVKKIKTMEIERNYEIFVIINIIVIDMYNS